MSFGNTVESGVYGNYALSGDLSTGIGQRKKFTMCVDGIGIIIIAKSMIAYFRCGVQNKRLSKTCISLISY
ncbi:MAG: hypothetical protein LUI05_01335 [Oscillospiraceae bacterium]|nr:hypothetical protein [Oscillospiraceae bacterium]